MNSPHSETKNGRKTGKCPSVLGLMQVHEFPLVAKIEPFAKHCTGIAPMVVYSATAAATGSIFYQTITFSL